MLICPLGRGGEKKERERKREKRKRTRGNEDDREIVDQVDSHKVDTRAREGEKTNLRRGKTTPWIVRRDDTDQEKHEPTAPRIGRSPQKIRKKLGGKKLQMWALKS